MDTYENEVIPQPEKKSPYADSPYECVYTEPEIPEQPKPDKPKRRGRPLLVFLLLICACVVTAALVSNHWEGRLAQMENAMNEKFAALEKIYTDQKQDNVISRPSATDPVTPDTDGATTPPATDSVNPDKDNTTSAPSVTGPLTPGQVYAENVKAVVAVNSRVQSGNGYAEGSGSGFIISADGYVVTNYHVVEQAKEVTVIPYGGEELTAKVIGSDASNDIALLKVEGENLPYVTLGNSDALAVGDMVAAIGTPLGELTASLTVGYISAKDRIVNTDGTVINMLQTDAAINSGNSGGPLFDMNGKVVGITTAKYSGNSNSGAAIEGLGFAIPIDDVESILTDLKEFGYVTGAYLGVYVRDVDTSAQSYGLPAGAYIEEAIQGYCAREAGIRTGDIIVNLGGYEVDSVTTLTRVLRRFEAGDSVSVTVYRAGKQEYLTVVLDEKPAQTQETLPGGDPA